MSENGTFVNYMLSPHNIMVMAGDQTGVYSAGSPEYDKAKAFITADDMNGLSQLVRGLKDSIERSYEGFRVENGHVFVEDEALPVQLGQKMKTFADQNLDYKPLLNFWEKLKQNPSMTSVENLFVFLERNHCPITKDGYIQCYKAIRADWTDKHTGKINNSPGTLVSTERRFVDDDIEKECSFGYHVGGHKYVSGFHSGDERVVEVLVNPAHVVAVNSDVTYDKMRVHEYTVLKEINPNEWEAPERQVYEDPEDDDDYGCDYCGVRGCEGDCQVDEDEFDNDDEDEMEDDFDEDDLPDPADGLDDDEDETNNSKSGDFPNSMGGGGFYNCW